MIIHTQNDFCCLYHLDILDYLQLEKDKKTPNQWNVKKKSAVRELDNSYQRLKDFEF